MGAAVLEGSVIEVPPDAGAVPSSTSTPFCVQTVLVRPTALRSSSVGLVFRSVLIQPLRP